MRFQIRVGIPGECQKLSLEVITADENHLNGSEPVSSANVKSHLDDSYVRCGRCINFGCPGSSEDFEESREHCRENKHEHNPHNHCLNVVQNKDRKEGQERRDSNCDRCAYSLEVINTVCGETFLRGVL